ncbi:MAG: zinc ribbon domain-containing protein [Candidatus Heimdallarchaeota archaeon]
MDNKKIQCPNCGKKIDSWFVYCEYCGNALQPESIKKQIPSSTIKSNVEIRKIPATETTEAKQVIIIPTQKEKKHKWYTPPKRKRPGYHPLEWFFWIGWGIYVAFRFLIIAFFNYIKWCCWWGPPKGKNDL